MSSARVSAICSRSSWNSALANKARRSRWRGKGTFRSAITRPGRWLIDFQQVTLGPGECRTLRFRVTPDQFSYPLAPSLEDAEWVRDPGLILLHIGANSRDTQTMDLTWLD